MRESKKTTITTTEGLRERKRRQTRERISNAALTLFLERGFEATTVDDIAAAAEVSKRGFFDYFPTKEDVVAAWQDEFSNALLAAVAARPAKELLTKVVEEALISTILDAINPQSLAIGKLIKGTPALRARDHLKYAKLEQKLYDALAARTKGKQDQLRLRLLAMVTIGTLRVAGEVWSTDQLGKMSAPEIRRISKLLWEQLREFGSERAES
ncbi:AcrR family transcriptional regulator [Nitrobacteraceae bacterium AZCC 1564]